LSGGWAKGSSEVAGDLVCVSGEEFPLHIECKHQEGWNWESVLTGQSAVFASWYEQAINDSPPGKLPVVVFKKNYGSIYIATCLFYYEISSILPYMRVQVKIDAATVIVGITTLESFLNHWTVYDIRQRFRHRTLNTVSISEG
jgi:hypothetical protein